MTALKVEPDPAVGALLIAGRRAAYGALRVGAQQAAAHREVNWLGVQPEAYDGASKLAINNFDIGPAIDAAVLETIVRLNHPDEPAPVRRRRWWQLWGKR